MKIPDYPEAIRLEGTITSPWYTRFRGKVLGTQIHPRELTEQALTDIAGMVNLVELRENQ